jgi:hypothetical protein
MRLMPIEGPVLQTVRRALVTRTGDGLELTTADALEGKTTETDNPPMLGKLEAENRLQKHMKRPIRITRR